MAGGCLLLQDRYSDLCLQVSDYLCSTDSPADYLAKVQSHGQSYRGFNLIVGNMSLPLSRESTPEKHDSGSGMYYYSNREETLVTRLELEGRAYGLSNGVLKRVDEWPKVVRGRASFERMIANPVRRAMTVAMCLLYPSSSPLFGASVFRR
jgi:uncharacterized protein with NRDE domain